MKWRVCLLLLLSAVVLGARAGEVADPGALAALDRFMTGFNSRDVSAWADSLVYPHVRIASGDVAVYPDRESFIAAMNLTVLVDREGWHHSAWEDLEVIQASPEKVHVAVVFVRFNADGEAYARYRSLYVLENVGGRWGVRARSSFAP